jgi:hypothetical protein
MFKAQVDQLVYDFNCQPIGYVDVSWLDDSERAPIARLAASADPQARALASCWLLERFGLHGAYDFEFTLPSKRLLLLDAAALSELSLFLGLSALGHRLRTWVLGSQQVHLRDAVGENAFAFYVDRVLPHPPVARWLLGREQAMRQLEGPVLLQSVMRIGALLLLMGADAPGTPALRRAQLKLPRPAADVNRVKPMSPQRQRAVLEFCVGCVIRERYTSWHWLF